MKKALHYAIRVNGWSPRVVAVTQERSGRWWGRTTDDCLGTHGRDEDIRGRFDTQEEAEKVKGVVQSVSKHFTNAANPLTKGRFELSRREEAITKQVLVDGVYPGELMPEVRVVIQNEDEQSRVRDEIATVLERIAKEGMPEPRDLDAALDAILATAGVL